MSLSIDELFTAPTEDEVFDGLLTQLEATGIPARSWEVGGTGRSMLRVIAKAFAGLASFITAFIRAGFLETSEGAWLTLLARYVYGVERVGATFASGEIRLINAGGNVYNFVAEQVRVSRTTSSGVVYTYTNPTAFSLNPGDDKLVTFVATVQGSVASAPPNTITKLETYFADVTCTNPVAVVGTDEQTDSELRSVCLDKLASLAMGGPQGAYGYAVRTAKRLDGSPVNINRFARSADSSVGVVTLYCASPSGAPSAEDLQAVRDRIEEVCARPDSVTVNVLAATPVSFTRTITVWAIKSPGLTASDVGELVSQALIAWIKTYPIGGLKKPPSAVGYLYADAVAGVALRAHAATFDVDFDVVADMALAAGEVASLATTINVRVVEGA